jgi:hypothetical protein
MGVSMQHTIIRYSMILLGLPVLAVFWALFYASGLIAGILVAVMSLENSARALHRMPSSQT